LKGFVVKTNLSASCPKNRNDPSFGSMLISLNPAASKNRSYHQGVYPP